MHESVAHVRPPDQAALPRRLEPQRVLVENRVEAVAQTHTDTARYGPARAAKDPAHHRAVIHLPHATVLPCLLIVLIAPMAGAAAINTREGGENLRNLRRIDPSVMPGLLRVEVVNAIAVDLFLPVGVRRRIQRLTSKWHDRRVVGTPGTLYRRFQI